VTEVFSNPETSADVAAREAFGSVDALPAQHYAIVALHSIESFLANLVSVSENSLLQVNANAAIPLLAGVVKHVLACEVMGNLAEHTPSGPQR